MPGTKFLALWHSSKTMQPSKEGPPYQSITCCSRPLPFIWEISVVYVLQQQSRLWLKGQRQQGFSAQEFPSSCSLQCDISQGNSNSVHSMLCSTDTDLYVSSAFKPDVIKECSMRLPALRNRQVAWAWQMCGQTDVPVLIHVSSSAYMKRTPSCMSLAKPVALVSLSRV